MDWWFDFGHSHFGSLGSRDFCLIFKIKTKAGVVYICVSGKNASFPTRPFVPFRALPLCLFFMVRRILDSFIQICINYPQMMCQQLNITFLICSYKCAEVWELKRVKV